MRCEWCEENKARAISCTVYWELPDGSRAIEITDAPGFVCDSCGMEYQEEQLINDIEDQLLLINVKLVEKSITFKELMAKPKTLKRNYFRF
ncbi:YokU family protein [Halalkalibacter akibai]|uniref:YokU family protein n=1 Tax=Halalkalibacter akibai (strain ATCC 43226 / DSM 21942 / CIP 109018 / JCM 9157 / 1139) TaxID=1236973 RepID=W4QYI9_HALA3|nr:YokU family protein [Halalkalibacter akibai]GAE36947.1 hypothetical protein JCM9157_4183 [Halalkalibacter akibai JCM 9157]